jgi:hypothetical protein
MAGGGSLNDDFLRGRNRVFGAGIPLHRIAKGAGNSLENGLAPVMSAPSAQNINVQRESGVIYKALPKILAEIIGRQPRLKNEVWPAAEIKRNAGQSLVHRIKATPRTANPPAFPQCLSQRLPKNDARILNKMMVIHLNITSRAELNVKKPVFRKQSEHVSIKTRRMVNPRHTRPVEVEPQPNRRLSRLPFNHRAPRHHYLLKSADLYLNRHRLKIAFQIKRSNEEGKSHGNHASAPLAPEAKPQSGFAAVPVLFPCRHFKFS